MVTVTKLMSFAVPRNPMTVAPSLREVLLFPVDGPIIALWDTHDYHRGAGDRILWREALPVREGKTRKGRLFEYRDALLFAPNTLKGAYRDLHTDVIKPTGDVVKAANALSSFQLNLKGKDEDDPIGEFVENAIEWLDPEEEREPGEAETYWALREHSMKLPGALCMPFCDLVEASMWETKAGGLVERFTHELGKHIGLTFEARDGSRSTVYFTSTLKGSEGRAIRYDPGDKRKPEYKAGGLSTDEATLLLFMKMRFRAEAGFFIRQLQDEVLGLETRQRGRSSLARAKFANYHEASSKLFTTIFAEEQRVGFAVIKRIDEIMRRMGPTLAAFADMPFERHKLGNPISELTSGAMTSYPG